jgi:ADP-ribosylglycohydrolase
MRCAVIGGFFAGDIEQIRKYVRASTRLTHTDPKAETAALAVALTASWIVRNSESNHSNLDELFDLWRSAGPDDATWTGCLQTLRIALNAHVEVCEFARQLGLERGVTGYCYHSVPVALYAWIRHKGDFRKTMETALDCGGDTDTVGAICGALAGVDSEIPSDWINSIADWPISTMFLTRLAEALEDCKTGQLQQHLFFPWMAIPFRNLLFLFIVLTHGFRRLVPSFATRHIIKNNFNKPESQRP